MIKGDFDVGVFVVVPELRLLVSVCLVTGKFPGLR